LGERCPDHDPPFGRSTYRTRPAISAELRARILARDGGLCWCGEPATDVDHVVPRSLGGSDEPSNLQSLCGPHHRSKTGRDARRARSLR
jgi:5-methylcytosine-specific restriction protein A